MHPITQNHSHKPPLMWKMAGLSLLLLPLPALAGGGHHHGSGHVGVTIGGPDVSVTVHKTWGHPPPERVIVERHVEVEEDSYYDDDDYEPVRKTVIIERDHCPPERVVVYKSRRPVVRKKIIIHEHRPIVHKKIVIHKHHPSHRKYKRHHLSHHPKKVVVHNGRHHEEHREVIRHRSRSRDLFHDRDERRPGRGRGERHDWVAVGGHR